jgi:hypothetical protein
MNKSQENIRQLLWDQINSNNINIYAIVKDNDHVHDTICEVIDEMTNEELSDAISHILSDKPEQEVIDAYLQKAITSVQDYIRDNDIFEVCDKLGIML